MHFRQQEMPAIRRDMYQALDAMKEHIGEDLRFHWLESLPAHACKPWQLLVHPVLNVTLSNSALLHQGSTVILHILCCWCYRFKCSSCHTFNDFQLPFECSH